MPRNPYNRKVDFVFYWHPLVFLSVLGDTRSDTGRLLS